MKAKAPDREVVIVITVTETPEGKVHIGANVPSHAEGTCALVLADAAVTVMREMLRRVGAGEGEVKDYGRMQ